MSTNNNPLGNLDFSKFILTDNDASNNLFRRNNQAPGSFQPANNIACSAGNGYMAVSRPTSAQDRHVSAGGITPIVDMNELNRGFSSDDSKKLKKILYPT